MLGVDVIAVARRLCLKADRLRGIKRNVRVKWWKECESMCKWKCIRSRYVRCMVWERLLLYRAQFLNNNAIKHWSSNEKQRVWLKWPQLRLIPNIFYIYLLESYNNIQNMLCVVCLTTQYWVCVCVCRCYLFSPLCPLSLYSTFHSSHLLESSCVVHVWYRNIVTIQR